MACTTTLSSIGFDCNTNLAGVKAIYIAQYPEGGADVSTNASGEIISMDASSFYTYLPAKNTGSLTKTMTKDESTGVKYYTNEVTGNFNRMNAEKRKALAGLDGGQLIVVVEDLNGEYWYLGKDNYVTATAITGQTGTSPDDGNNYTLTLTDTSAELPYPLSEAAITAFKAKIV